MAAAIYARTCTAEKLHHTTRIENQVEYCRQVAAKHNVQVSDSLVFTDVEEAGDLWPSCWVWDTDAPSRPAISVLIEAIESNAVDAVLVHRLDALGTSSEVLQALADLLQQRQVPIIVEPEQLEPAADDYGEKFALSLLKQCVLVDSVEERKRRGEIRMRKVSEVERLQRKITRLEAEIAELS